jgi:DNA modification methylase
LHSGGDDIFQRPVNPYFQNGGVTIYHGDCLDVMAQLSPESVDMVAADLPYGSTACKWDSVINLDALWKEYSRITKPHAALCFTACQPFTSRLVMSNPRWFRYEWVWQKNRASNFLNAKKQPKKVHESILTFSRNAPRYFAQKTFGHQPINRASRRANSSTVYRTHKASTNSAGDTTRWPKSILNFRCIDNISKERVHPTQKPVELYQYLINTYTLVGETVLDNCSGSGTAGVACLRLGRRAILIESDESYCEKSVARIMKELEQPGLFAAA